jgi:hypothetical protein
MRYYLFVKRLGAPLTQAFDLNKHLSAQILPNKEQNSQSHPIKLALIPEK